MPAAMSSDNADTAPSPTGSSAGPLLGLDGEPLRIGVLTSGGDAQGMNAAVRAVVRTAIRLGARPYAVMEGWAGAVAGGDGIRPLEWDSVGSILQRGGTIIGTARSAEFRERAGQLAAARNLLEHGIDRLVVIGGDGSLTGTNEFRKNWPSLLEELVAGGDISAETAAAHPVLMVTGLVGSIDNDLVGADMTIGTASWRPLTTSPQRPPPTSAPSSWRSWAATAATWPSWRPWPAAVTTSWSPSSPRARTGRRTCAPSSRRAARPGAASPW